MKVKFTEKSNFPVSSSRTIAFFLFDDGLLSEHARRADVLTGGLLSRALSQSRFSGRPEQILEICVPENIGAFRVLLIGVGKKEEVDKHSIENAAAVAYRAAALSGASTLELSLSEFASTLVAHAIFGARLSSYRFDKYRTNEQADTQPSVNELLGLCEDRREAMEQYSSLDALADAVFFARDLVSEPANILNPSEFAARVQELSHLGLKIELLDASQMAHLGMGAILGVGQGSEQKSLLATMQWQGGPSSMAPLAFVGKGVCFDTGGITLKPGTGMESMIWDMAGAAAVAGAMHVLAGRKAKVNAVGVLGLVENMPDGNAQRPGDIVKSMSGQTIEIISTDAEGRLVLADALWYCQDRFKPSIMIDLATLTGASKVALGPEFAALFSNSDELADHLVSASNVSGDRLWRLPLSEKMEESLVSTSADMKNFSDNTGSAITGALFLQKFVNQSTWAHIDMTPTAWFNKSCSPTIPDGASGYGVRLLDQFVSDFFES